MKKMNLISKALILIALTAAASNATVVRAEEQSAQEEQSTCTVVDGNGVSFFWMHPVPQVAAQYAMGACRLNSPFPYTCVFMGCSFY